MAEAQRARTIRDDLRTALTDKWLWIAIVLGLALRILPMVIWPQLECVRDECIYRTLAGKIIGGQGLTVSSKGWLPAPGYPYVMAWSKMFFGSYMVVKYVQVGLQALSTVVLYLLALRTADRKVAAISAMLFALNPTLAFYAGTWWIETIYIFLMLGAMLGAIWARGSKWWVAAIAGLFLGVAILFRGVATYLPPMFALGILWPWDDEKLSFATFKLGLRDRWQHAAALCVTVLITVAPYSIYASPRQGGFLVTDATVGHVMFLGNNDFPPLTFDYGNGMLTNQLYGKYLRLGRKPCDRRQPPVISSKCDVQMAVHWMGEHPAEMVERVPMRIAQLLNPNSFLTRHMRWGYWPGLPWFLKEGISVWVAATTIAITLLGTVGAILKGRGPYGLMSAGTVAYTVFASAIMYGMTRFRLPLEPLWIVYMAMVLADWRSMLQAVREHPVRAALLVATLPVLVVLMSWYLPTGFPMFW